MRIKKTRFGYSEQCNQRERLEIKTSGDDLILWYPAPYMLATIPYPSPSTDANNRCLRSCRHGDRRWGAQEEGRGCGGDGPDGRGTQPRNPRSISGVLGNMR